MFHQDRVGHTHYLPNALKRRLLGCRRYDFLPSSLRYNLHHYLLLSENLNLSLKFFESLGFVGRDMRAVAYAINSESLGGKSKEGFIQTTATLTQARLENFIASIIAAGGNSVKWDGSQFVSYGCSVSAPASCTFNNVTVPHGGSIRAYFTNSAEKPDHCFNYEENRRCTNGILSGSAPYQICDQINYYWNTYVAVISPCSGPYNDGRGGIECSSSNEGATAIGSHCGAPLGTVWTCTKVINPLFEY